MGCYFSKEGCGQKLASPSATEPNSFEPEAPVSPQVTPSDETSIAPIDVDTRIISTDFPSDAMEPIMETAPPVMIAEQETVSVYPMLRSTRDKADDAPIVDVISTNEPDVKKYDVNETSSPDDKIDFVGTSEPGIQDVINETQPPVNPDIFVETDEPVFGNFVATGEPVVMEIEDLPDIETTRLTLFANAAGSQMTRLRKIDQSRSKVEAMDSSMEWVAIATMGIVCAVLFLIRRNRRAYTPIPPPI